MTDRYCNFRATTLDEIFATCERHMKNINMTKLDLIQEGDGTETDFFYCDMFFRAWHDLYEDILAMKAKQNEAQAASSS